MVYAEQVFQNGIIYTQNPALPRASSVAVTGDKIIAVGSDGEVGALVGPDTKVMDLQGRFMMPGFHDSHCHLLQQGLSLMNVDLTPETAPDIKTLKGLISQRAAEEGPGKWIVGWGYNETQMREKRHPTLQELTAAAPDNPVIITRGCVHMSVANQMAMELAGISDDSADPPDGIIERDEGGRLTGLLKEGAQDAVKACVPRPGKAEIVRALELASTAFLEKGLTSVWDAGTLLEIDDELAGWMEAAVSGALKIRCVSSLTEGVADRAMEYGLVTGYGGDMHKFGPVKMFMDGNIGGKTAGVYEPFLLPPYGQGVLYMEPDVLKEKVKHYHDAGYQIAVHAIGDRSVDLVLEAYEEALAANPRPDHRHRIEHITLGANCIPRIVKNGVLVTLQPAFVYFYGADFEPNVGKARSDKIMAARTASDSGLTWGISTDCPVLDIHPKYTLYAAITREVLGKGLMGREEAITVEEALKAYTTDAAYLSFQEGIKGRIKPGMLADFTVLSLDPTAIQEPGELLEMEVLHTILGGKVVYSRL